MASLTEIKRGPNFILYTDGKAKVIKLEHVRVSYPWFGTQSENESESGEKQRAWGGVAMLHKQSHMAAAEAFKDIMREILTANEVKIPAEYRCMKDGDEKDKKEYEGHWLINFSEKGKYRPAARNKDGQVIDSIEEIDEMFYGGCYIDVLLRPWYFNGKAKSGNKTYPKRICCGYTGVMFNEKGEPFGEGRIDDSAAWGTPSTAKSDPMDDDL